MARGTYEDGDADSQMVQAGVVQVLDPLRGCSARAAGHRSKSPLPAVFISPCVM
jgi:hypothetical protein